MITTTTETTTPDAPAEAPTPKTWQEKRKRRHIQISLTQLETFDLCKRKWALDKVRQLPSPEISAGPFGTVLHSVAERFLKADALGRDTNGNPVDLYPPHWTEARNRYKPDEIDGIVSPAEAEVITKLIQAAIDEGVLSRRPEQLVETGFTDTVTSLKCHQCEGSGHVVCPTCNGQVAVPVQIAGKEVFARCPDCTNGFAKCPTCEGDGKGDTITMTGFIDSLGLPDTVEDHKTTKSMRYAKSKNELMKNIQMLGYAKQLIDHLKKEGRPIPEKICLRHNVYCKDPNDLRVRKTEVFVTPEEIMEFWEGIKVMAAEMSAIRRNFNGWHSVPPPSNMAKACQAFGGCQFRSICGGQESEEAYESRINKFIKSTKKMLTPSEDGGKLLVSIPVPINDNPEPERKPMGLLENMKQRMAAIQQAPVPGAQAAPVQVAAPAPVAVPVQTPPAPSAQAIPNPTPTAAGEMNTPAPWAAPDCRACQGSGFDTKGNPCRVCEVSAVRTRARHPSSAFEIIDAAPGLKFWRFKAVAGVEGICPISFKDLNVKREAVVQVPVTPVAVEVPMTHVPITTAPTVQTPHNTPAIATQVANGQAAAPTTRGRAKKGFTLVLNATVTFGSGPAPKVTRLVDTFAEIREELEKAMAAAGTPKVYQDMDAFRRRDEVAKVAEQLAEGFGTNFVVADVANGTPDFKALVEAIRPYAAQEIVGSH